MRRIFAIYIYKAFSFLPPQSSLVYLYRGDTKKCILFHLLAAAAEVLKLCACDILEISGAWFVSEIFSKPTIYQG